MNGSFKGRGHPKVAEGMTMPMLLGSLIKRLEACKPEASVYFDFCSLTTDGVGSYRGYYEQLAIGWKEDGAATKVSELLQELKGAVGKTFQGYKGGDYEMHEGTPVWCANYGRSGSTAIVGVLDQDWCAILETRYEG